MLVGFLYEDWIGVYEEVVCGVEGGILDVEVVFLVYGSFRSWYV